MNSCELVTLISALSCAVAECYPIDQVELLGTIFTQLGDSLLTISAHNEFCCSKDNDLR